MKEFTGTIVIAVGSVSMTELSIAFPGITFELKLITRIEGVVMQLERHEIRSIIDGRPIKVGHFVTTVNFMNVDEMRRIVEELRNKAITARRDSLTTKYGSLIYFNDKVEYESRVALEKALYKSLHKLLPEVHVEISLGLHNRYIVELYGPAGWTAESMEATRASRWHNTYEVCPTCGEIHNKK